MLNRLPLTALLLGLGLLLGSLALAEPPVGEKQIAELIAKLGSADFDEREAANQELDKLGPAALDALKAATKSEDAEIRKRAEELVTLIERRESSGRLLKPTRVTLDLKDAPVAEAVAALRKESGFPIQLVDTENTLKEKRVTLQVKDATFFEALEALCDKAGLVEGQPAAQAVPGAGPGVPQIGVRPIQRIQRAIPVRPVPVQPGVLPVQPDQPAPQRGPGFGFAAQAQETTPAAPPQAVPPVPPQAAPVPVQVIGPIQIQGQVQGRIIIGGPGGVILPGMPGMAGGQGDIVLSPGKADKLPTDAATAFRVRALPNPIQIQVPGITVLSTTLQVTPEPRLSLAGIDGVTPTKVIDDQDQKLLQFDPNAPLNVPGGGPAGVGIAFPGGFVGPFGGSNTVPLYFKAGEKQSRSLKELSGTIAARVLVPHSKAITVEKLAEAGGKTFKGEKGGEIKIVSVSKEENAVRVQFELTPAKDAVGAEGGNEGVPFAPFGPGGIQIAPGGVAPAIIPPQPPQAAPRPAPQRAPRPVPPGQGFAVQAPQAPQAAPAAQAPAPPPVQIQAVPAIAPAPPGVVIGGFGGGFGATLPAGLRIVDEKGNAVVILGIQQQFMIAPNAPPQRIWDVQIQQGKDQPRVATLTWQQHKSASVDIPFTLKDVPLK